MKHEFIVQRNQIERELLINPDSIELRKKHRVLTITINWL